MTNEANNEKFKGGQEYKKEESIGQEVLCLEPDLNIVLTFKFEPKIASSYKVWTHWMQYNWSKQFNLNLTLTSFSFCEYSLELELKGLPFLKN